MRRLLSACLLACSLSTAAHAAQPDILGLTLGMTPDQAEAALKAGRPDLKLERDMLAYTFSDGVKEHKTPEFVSHIIATTARGKTMANLEDERIILTFNQQAGAQRLLMVGRTVSAINKPVSMEAYKGELVKKYGPATKVSDIPSSSSELTWKIGGGDMDCYGKSASGQNVAEFHTVLRIPSGIAPEKCAAHIFYQIYQEPVVNVSALMIDPAAMAAAEEATQKWVGGLEAEARAKRGAQGEAPKL